MNNVNIFTLDRAVGVISQRIHEILEESETGFSALGMKEYQQMDLYMEELEILYFAFDLKGNVDSDEVDRRSKYVQDLLLTVNNAEQEDN